MLRSQEQVVTGRVQTILNSVNMLGKVVAVTLEKCRLACLALHPCGCPTSLPSITILYLDSVVRVGHPGKVLPIALHSLTTVECSS